jgi:hypothetical protein
MDIIEDKGCHSRNRSIMPSAVLLSGSLTNVVLPSVTLLNVILPCVISIFDVSRLLSVKVCLHINLK